MHLDKMTVKNFKSLHDVEIEFGRINVFIGANGVGKTSILEALGIISAVMEHSMEQAALISKGIRSGSPQIYKNSSKTRKTSPMMTFALSWKSQSQKDLIYSFSVGAPMEGNETKWKMSAESLKDSSMEKGMFGRSNRSSEFEYYQNIEVSKYRSMYGVVKSIREIGEKQVDWDDIDITKQLGNYAIYNPSLLGIRGSLRESEEGTLLGLFGENTVKTAIKMLKSYKDIEKASSFLEYLQVNEWLSGIGIELRGFDVTSRPELGVFSREQIVFRDRFMKVGRNQLSILDANEGALFCLFLACLIHHPQAPKVFAIDNFDSGMNPRVAKKITEMICDDIKETDRTVLLATHNPLVLDGLNIKDKRIKLFVVDRDKNGDTIIDAIQSTPQGDFTLSELWLMGRIGGMPPI